MKKIPTSHPKRFYLERLAKLIGDYYYQQYQTSAIHRPDKNALTQAVKYYHLLSFNVTKSPKTYFNLANLYWIGLQDPLKALSYFEYLRDHGDPDSKRMVDAIKPRLSDAQTKRMNRMPQPSHTLASTGDNQPTHQEEHNPLISNETNSRF